MIRWTRRAQDFEVVHERAPAPSSTPGTPDDTAGIQASPQTPGGNVPPPAQEMDLVIMAQDVDFTTRHLGAAVCRDDTGWLEPSVTVHLEGIDPDAWTLIARAARDKHRITILASPVASPDGQWLRGEVRLRRISGVSAQP